MPLGDESGCLFVLLKGIAEVALQVFGGVTDSKLSDLLGHLGAWVERIFTLGFSDPDPESWFSIIFGWVLFIFLIMAGSYWALRGR